MLVYLPRITHILMGAIMCVRVWLLLLVCVLMCVWFFFCILARDSIYGPQTCRRTDDRSYTLFSCEYLLRIKRTRFLMELLMAAGKGTKLQTAKHTNAL